MMIRDKEHITGILLSGGKSRRMGSDKAFVIYHDKELLEHAIDLLKPLCDEIIISANEPIYGKYGYTVIQDRIKNIGPIGGIVSVAESCSNDRFIVMACDMPGINHQIMQKLISEVKENDLVFLENDKSIQSLPFGGSKKLLPLINRQIDAKNYKLNDLLRLSHEDKTVKSMKIQIASGLININSPKDLEQ